ncbi:MAG TPA: Hsp20/alpha crystallin family protein [Candidatus Hydrogenedentes bacterium]|nr:Hsp20/alpha crystallin family protein [Candidatus Hydrogenedentota bacterium]HQE84359.1 Hsp20/alpha crystallin family protein [Candidatus Hydrogenedentota bacterium]HQH53403.1 Hsp20/alpha crystallin family protein [Candidatus Hydrogenedentota bacterium]HQM47230.1 Hsp20/alpha crystallin family protein [Candidatus Hydrogenedentota bacterium]
MALVRWRHSGDVAPWSALADLQNELARMFGDHGFEWDRPSQTWNPPMDLQETENEYVLQADVPGMKREDVEITALDNTVKIRGKREYERRDEEKNVHRMERHYGEFQRTFELPGGFDANKVEATLRDGVLRVRLPKREESKPKRISLDVE